MFGVSGHFSQHHCQWSLPRVSMWFYLNLNFSTFKVGQADLTIIVIEVTQIQTLSAPLQPRVRTHSKKSVRWLCYRS